MRAHLRALSVIVGISALALSLVISSQFAVALVLLLTTSMALWQFSNLRPYTWTLSIAILLLLSLCCLVLGVPGWVAGVLVVVIAGAVLALGTVRRTIDWPDPTALMGAAGIFFVVASTLAIGSLVNRSAAISWVMMGDGFEWIRYLGDLRTLTTFEVITTGLFPRLTMSAELLAQTVIIPSAGVSGLLADIQANVAWVLLALIAAAADLLRNFGGAPRGRVAFGQGVFVSFVMSSTLIAGLVAANGFLSVAPTVALYVLGLISVTRHLRNGDRTSWMVTLVAVAALVTSWQPFALVVAGLLLGILVARRIPVLHSWWPLISGVLVAIVTLATVLITTGAIPAAGAGHFPATPLSVLLLVFVALLVVTVRSRARGIALTITVGFVAGSLTAFVSFRGGGLFAFLAAIHNTGITPFYYVQKFVWIAAVPAVLLLAVVIASQTSVQRLGRRTSALASALLIAASFTAAAVPNFPWLPLGSRSDILELGDLVLDPTVTSQPRVFVGYQAPHVDAVINSWNGLLWDRYLSTDASGEGPGWLRKEVIWASIQGGDFVGAACAAGESASGPLTIVTSQAALQGAASSSCPDSLTGVQFEFRIDRGA